MNSSLNISKTSFEYRHTFGNAIGQRIRLGLKPQAEIRNRPAEKAARGADLHRNCAAVINVNLVKDLVDNLEPHFFVSDLLHLNIWSERKKETHHLP